jgi:RND family efflux transporter MFP subunit
MNAQLGLHPCKPLGLAFAIGLSAALLVSCERGAQSGPSARSGPPTRAVQVTRAELRPMQRSIAVSGTLAAQEKSTLSAKVPGRLEQIAVDIGSVVRRGDLLAQVEPRDYELGLQEAAAALAQARTTLGLAPEGEDDRVELDQLSAVKQAKAVLDEATNNRQRVKDLSKSGIASQSELDTVEATYTVALTRYSTAQEEARTRLAITAQRRAAYEIARKSLADASVRAPFDGAIQARPASLGEYVAVGSPIVELVKMDPLRLRLQVPERESLLVRTGQVVRLFVEGDTNAYRGRTARLSPALEEQCRMLLVEADVPRQGSLRPGLFARAEVIVNEGEDAVSVPGNALITFAGLEKVIVVQDGKALEKIVATGRRGPGWVEIVSGLGLDETIVLDPGSLRTGQPVTVASRVENPGAVAARKETGP